MSHDRIQLGGVGHCFAWHVRVSLGLYFNSILKQKNLYIVSCVQCNIWDITAYFILPELKYRYELFKANKIISHHLGHFLLTE
jgi:hypothetical protein